MRKPWSFVLLVVLGLAGAGGYLYVAARAPRASAPATEPTASTTTPRPQATPPPEPEPEERVPVPTHREVYVHELPPGDGTGIDAFPRPGTKPVKSGILVPEDFDLPPGYVRHTQYTDDGDELPAVLMFHPDHKLTDAAGHPVPLPADLLVPPELAPPGMPIRMLGKVPVRADLDEDGKPLAR